MCFDHLVCAAPQQQQQQQQPASSASSARRDCIHNGGSLFLMRALSRREHKSAERSRH